MPDSNLADNSVLTSSFYNTYIREQVVVTCTSSTRPTGVEGRLIYETDDNLLRVYDGSSWQRVANDSGDQLQAGEESGTTDSDGLISVTFPSAFAAAPNVVATRRSSSTGTQQRGVHVQAVSTTAVTFACHTNDSSDASTSVIINWMAFGRIA